MNQSILKSSTILLLIISVVFSACEEDDETPVGSANATFVEDLAADPEQNTDGTAREQTSRYTLFSFADNAVVDNEDSVSTEWDIGFRGTSIIVNGGESGPGDAAVQIVSTLFEDLAEAPADGYSETVANGSWYTYTGEAPTGPQHAILPQAGKIFVVRTAEGRYAKMEILSYYLGNPDTTTEEFESLATRPPSRYYTFRFVYQPNGSTVLEEE